VPVLFLPTWHIIVISLLSILSRYDT